MPCARTWRRRRSPEPRGGSVSRERDHRAQPPRTCDPNTREAPEPHRGVPMRRRGPTVLTAVLAAAAFTVLPAVPARADSIRAQQWELAAMHTQQAWRTSKGRGITVAVLDTGVDSANPDLTGQVLPDKDLIGFGARRGDRSWARHGTAMAGIVAGHGHGPGRTDGVLGIAPEAHILPVRVILEGSDPAIKKARASRGTPSPPASAGPPTTTPTSSTSPSATTVRPPGRSRARTRPSSTRSPRALSSSRRRATAVRTGTTSPTRPPTPG